MVEIKQVNLYHLRMPLVQPFVTSFCRTEERDGILIEVLGDGLHGYGECAAMRHPWYSSESSQTAWHILSEYLIPIIFEGTIEQANDFYSRAEKIKGHPMAKAGLELALWDLIGKKEGKSLQQILGGVRDRVPVGVSIGIQESTDTLLKVVEDYQSQGYQRVKLKIKKGHDLEVVQPVREAFPTLALQVDANSAYALEDFDQLKKLDGFDLLLIEQPLGDEDLWQHSQLQKEMETPICLDESIWSLHQAKQALAFQACRVVNIKQGRVGGISQAVAIHNLCSQADIPVWCGGMLETGVGRAANLALASMSGFSLPGDISATDRYYDQDITKQVFELNREDSTITVPQGPGIGVDLDMKAVEKFTIRKETFRKDQS